MQENTLKRFIQSGAGNIITGDIGWHIFYIKIHIIIPIKWAQSEKTAYL